MKRVIALIMALIFIGVGFYIYNASSNLAKRCTESVEGIVVEVVREENYDYDDGTTSYTYYPVIEYDANGKKVSKRYGTGTNPSKYSVRDSVNVKYNPNNVEEYIIDGDKGANIFGIIFAAVGIFLLIYGVIFNKVE